MWELQERIPVTLLMMRSFSIFLGKSRGSVAFHDPTAFSRLKGGGYRNAFRPIFYKKFFIQMIQTVKIQYESLDCVCLTISEHQHSQRAGSK